MTVAEVVVLCERVCEVELMNVARVDETKAAWMTAKKLWPSRQGPRNNPKLRNYMDTRCTS